jgi:hypothetical protein
VFLLGGTLDLDELQFKTGIEEHRRLKDFFFFFFQSQLLRTFIFIYLYIYEPPRLPYQHYISH